MNRRIIPVFTDGQLLAPPELGKQLTDSALHPLSAAEQLDPTVQTRWDEELSEISHAIKRDASRVPKDTLETERYLRNGLLHFDSMEAYDPKDPVKQLPRLMTAKVGWMSREISVPEYLLEPTASPMEFREVSEPSLDNNLHGGFQEQLRAQLRSNIRNIRSGSGLPGI